MNYEYNPLSHDMTAENEPIVVLGFDEEPKLDFEQVWQKYQQYGLKGMDDEERAFLAAALAEEEIPEPGHYDNLAEVMDEQDLIAIGRKVCEWVRDDDDSRSPWYKKEREGIKLLGVSPEVVPSANFEGASDAVHPLLGEACVQFNSRSIGAIWPAGGPVKTLVLGMADALKEEQAQRVEQFMNYQYTQMMPGAYDQMDQMLIRLPFSGSIFTKAYNDPIDGITRRMVDPVDFIVPYDATDLKTTPRYTERVKMTQNEVRKRQVAGIYRDIDLGQPNEDSHEETTIVDDTVKKAEGREDNRNLTDDDRHTIYECVCEYDLPGFPDLYPEDNEQAGKETGIALQYTMIVDRDSEKVLGIYRNWKEEDPDKRRLVYHTHYRFMPGLGFYGYGLLHWIGGLSKAATGSLRALLDSAGFSNMQGGFRAKGAALKNGEQAIGMGEWKEIDVEAEDLKNSLFPLPYSEPSMVMFNLLGHLENLGRRFAGTTEAMVGEGNQNTPVGTMLARIEEGGRVYTAIQKRIHESLHEELKIIAWLNSMFMPDRYPYAVPGEDREVLKEDFDDRVDVLPVSDPNMVSNVQRYFITQAVMELAGTASPGLYDERALHKRGLEALNIENIDELIPPRTENIKRMGPVEENVYAITGKPIRAFPEQNHQAHMIVHQQLLQTLGKDQESTAQAIHAHIQEHISQNYMLQMQQATGQQFVLPSEEDEQAAEIPVEVENQIAEMAAAAAQQFMQEMMQQPSPEQLEMEAEQARKDAAVDADISRKDAVAEADIERKDAIALAEQRRKNNEQIAALHKRNGLEPPNQ
ncbi:MAG: hypothetical protein N0E44_18170 [Candidatus Thiodiazotropha lotti]|nr:hypothetical protein [Candidatus Thiodiazotropha lotti]MCW4221810.1 hypothetical protein [Candidatus Thiodiazotropha lotti]